MNHDHKPARTPPGTIRPKPVWGAIIDAQGHEIPITDTMIRQACDKLEKSRGKAR